MTKELKLNGRWYINRARKWHELQNMGFSYKDIARNYYVSESTVSENIKSYVKNYKDKDEDNEKF